MKLGFCTCRSPRHNPYCSFCSNLTVNPTGAAKGLPKSPAKDFAESASTAGNKSATILIYADILAPFSTSSPASVSAVAPIAIFTK